MRRLRRGVAVTGVGALLACLLAGCGEAAGRSGDAQALPVAQGAFYVSDQTAAAKQLASLKGDDVALLSRITSRPSAVWLGGSDARAKAEAVTGRATAAGEAAILVAYDVPGRDCGKFSAGGAADGPEYRAWIADLAAGLADRAAWVVLEPDAIAHTLDSGCGMGTAASAERYELLAYAVRELKKDPKARVYLDAGNAGWVTDVGAMADALRKSGVAAADGFAVNVSNFYSTDQSSAFGGRLSAELGGQHFVIDTSRNGNGPAGQGNWCNPPGRALGEAPTTETGRPGVDAYLWVKNPGESDGDCGRGEPRAGEFWLPYALGLVAGR